MEYLAFLPSQYTELPLAHDHSQMRGPNTQKHILSRTLSTHTYQDPRRLSYQATHSHHTYLRPRQGHRNQGTKHPFHKDKTRYWHLELQSSQSQSGYPDASIKTQLTARTVSALEPSNPTSTGSEVGAQLKHKTLNQLCEDDRGT